MEIRNNSEHFTRVPNDPRRLQRGPSKQTLTGWELSTLESKENLTLIQLINPQVLCLHSDGDTLAKIAPAITKRMNQRFPQMEIACAIAGDRNTEKEPGYSDGWEVAAKMAADNGHKWVQLNCEVAWKSRPKGSGETALHEVHEAAPSMELRHTGYGAPDNVDGDLQKNGHQSFGGHHGGGLHEFTKAKNKDGKAIVAQTDPQHYWGVQGGQLQPRGRGLRAQDAYARSIASARGAGPNDEILPDVRIGVYLQLWGCRTDELAHYSEYYETTQWWATKHMRVTNAGVIAIACLSELYRLNLSIRDFQRKQSMDPHGWLDEATYLALFPKAPFGKYPQPQK